MDHAVCPRGGQQGLNRRSASWRGTTEEGRATEGRGARPGTRDRIGGPGANDALEVQVQEFELWKTETLKQHDEEKNTIREELEESYRDACWRKLASGKMLNAKRARPARRAEGPEGDEGRQGRLLQPEGYASIIRRRRPYRRN